MLPCDMRPPEGIYERTEQDSRTWKGARLRGRAGQSWGNLHSMHQAPVPVPESSISHHSQPPN